MSPSGGGGQISGPMGVPLPTGANHQGHVESSLLHRPSYSINGILGIPQPDANANSIAGIKRKRDEGGKILNTDKFHLDCQRYFLYTIDFLLSCQNDNYN